MKPRICVVGGSDSLSARLVELLAAHSGIASCRSEEPGIPTTAPGEGFDALVYVAIARSRDGLTPDLDDARNVLEGSLAAGLQSVVVVSSAAVNAPSPRHPGIVSEERLAEPRPGQRIARSWLALEELARELTSERDGFRLAILRATPVPLVGGPDYFSRLLSSRVALTPVAYDPSLQVLTPEDLTRAAAAATIRGEGIYNVAPKSVVPLRQALRYAGTWRLPVPHLVQWLLRKSLAPLIGPSRVAPVEQLEYLRHPWTISGEKIDRELGFRPQHSSVVGLKRLARKHGPESLASEDEPEFDAFGMDKDYIALFGRTLFRFLHDFYWRIETSGLEHVPLHGRGVLVGVHRGFMPWDGVMTLHLLVRRRSRYPRFLVHPTLVKFPFLTPYMVKLGGILACQENADWVLQRDELLGVYPEGIRGAFSLYRDVYRLRKFGRDEFVKMALRNRAPILPFVTVGSGEAHPIWGKLDWSWWKRYSEWPFFPVTVPLPLPSKWHTQFLEPLHVEEQYPPEAAEDVQTVREISREVRQRLQQAMETLRQRRPSIFYGSVFQGGQP